MKPERPAVAPNGKQLMSTEFTPSRRAVAKGVAWTAPVVALGVAAPLAQASEVPEPTCPSEAEKSAGVCADGQFFSVGATPSYSSTGGWLAGLSMTFHFNMFANCYSGAVNYHWNIGPATLTVTQNGQQTSYAGTNTLGQVSAGGAKIGVPTFFTFFFSDAKNLPEDADFTVTVPFSFNYPGGHTCYYNLSFTPPKRHLRTLLVRNPGPVTITQQ